MAGAGPALEPDEPACIEDIAATLDGKPIELTDDEIVEAESALIEEHEDERCEAMERRADERRDDR